MVKFPERFPQTARAEQRRETFRCGDKISHAENPRHVGRVDAVWTHQVRVTWECGIREDLHVSEPLVLVERQESPSFFWARKRRGPATERPSPKRRLEAYFAEELARQIPLPLPPPVPPKDLTCSITIVADRRRRP
jgi:hypothetical protein